MYKLRKKGHMKTMVVLFSTFERVLRRPRGKQGQACSVLYTMKKKLDKFSSIEFQMKARAVLRVVCGSHHPWFGNKLQIPCHQSSFSVA